MVSTISRFGRPTPCAMIFSCAHLTSAHQSAPMGYMALLALSPFNSWADICHIEGVMGEANP